MSESDITADLLQLTADLKQLEAEYNMFFAGRLPRPPWETRGRVEALIKRWDRRHIDRSGDRFRFQQLQARYASFVDLWDRGQRAREEGRTGPFAPPARIEPRPQKELPKEHRILHVTAFRDPLHEMEKLHALYDSLMDARREVGDDVVPFHRFATMVKDQVGRLRDPGTTEVAFRVTIKEGKVNFTARKVKED
ncbi:MAG TPA: MXAN_5187 C-terminal domain-containing protein [Vicinamibacterales bacterium]